MTDPSQRALRSRPPALALRWVETAVGPGTRVTSVRRLRGGDSSAVHAVTVERGGVVQPLVLRRFVRADWVAREPDIALREAAALRVLEPTQVPAPRLLAVDGDGQVAGVPSVLMTRLPGKTVLIPGDMDRWLQQLAEALPPIHAIRPTAEDLPWRWEPYNDMTSLQVPPWTKRPREWEAALEVGRGPRPQFSERLIHRDYHPANILWLRGRISGVADWVNACRGPSGVDIGHCRRNLAILHGVDVADRFLEHCLEWAEYDPYWDIVTLLDAELDDPVYEGWTDLGVTLPAPVAQTRLDEYAASLASRV